MTDSISACQFIIFWFYNHGCSSVCGVIFQFGFQISQYKHVFLLVFIWNLYIFFEEISIEWFASFFFTMELIIWY